MKGFKRIAALLICVTIIFTCVQVVSCAEISPLALNISTTASSITISGINSTQFAKMTTQNTLSLSIKMEQQKLKNGVYTTVETWTANKTGTVISLTETRLINVLATYRLKVTFKAGSETLVRYAYP